MTGGRAPRYQCGWGRTGRQPPLGPLTLAEVFGPLAEPATKRLAAPLSKKTAAKRQVEKPAKRKRNRERPASGPAKRAQLAKKAAADLTAAPKRSKPGRPPGMSPEKAAAIARYTEKVLNLIHAAGGWVATGDIHPQAGGAITQFQPGPPQASGRRYHRTPGRARLDAL
jgi:hypothetical protein